MNPPKGLQVDHINHDLLDNRKSNLRVCTVAENSRNTRKRTGTTSNYKGVSWHTHVKKWQARISYWDSGKQMWKALGYFSDETEAANAYDEAATKLFGEYAKTNF